MNLRYSPIFAAVSALVVGGTLLTPAAVRAQSATTPDVQFLTRGPVHEAFAETVSFDPQPGFIVRATPPTPIEELPPEQQLEGDNVTWIPGYWAWDDERNDFLWISGIWRNLPPGRQWIPGYWSGIGDGQSQWTSGYWADSAVTEVTYLATAPPRNLDIGPNIQASSSDQSWIPGNWIWAENRYLWRPGYWLPLRADWTWVPSRYCWSRRGYVYVDGYWDYAVASRGMLFAPVYFNRHCYAAPGWNYTPSIVIGINVFAEHLFVRPRSGHYYFGDYYASRYRADGYHASFSWNTGYRGYRGYDPICAYDRWQHRGDQNWEGRRRADFDFFRDHEDVRPRHTWAAMREVDNSHHQDGRNRVFAAPLNSIARTPANGQRFRTLDQGRRDQLVSQTREIRNFGQARNQMETRSRDASGRPSQPTTRESITRSPLVGRQVDRLASREAPPRRPEARGPEIRPNPAISAKQPSASARSSGSRTVSGRQGATIGKADLRAPAAGTPPSRPVPTGSSAGTNRGGSDPNRIRQVPARQADANTPRTQPTTLRQLPNSKPSTSPQPTQVTPQRQVQPQPSIRQTPQRQAQPTPQRQVQPQPSIRQTPQRQAQPTPQRQAQPQPSIRQTPQRQVQPTPQRQTRAQPSIRQAPQRQVQPTPQRQAQPQPSIRQAPQRQVQPTPQRQTRAQPSIRQAPQRQAQPTPQRQTRPQPSIRQAPQRQAQPTPQRQTRPSTPSTQSAAPDGRGPTRGRSR